MDKYLCHFALLAGSHRMNHNFHLGCNCLRLMNELLLLSTITGCEQKVCSREKKRFLPKWGGLILKINNGGLRGDAMRCRWWWWHILSWKGKTAPTLPGAAMIMRNTFSDFLDRFLFFQKFSHIFLRFINVWQICKVSSLSSVWIFFFQECFCVQGLSRFECSFFRSICPSGRGAGAPRKRGRFDHFAIVSQPSDCLSTHVSQCISHVPSSTLPFLYIFLLKMCHHLISLNLLS